MQGPSHQPGSAATRATGDRTTGDRTIGDSDREVGARDRVTRGAATRKGDSLVLFDLDGTLLRGDSGTRLIVGLLIRSPWRVLVAALLVPFLGPLILIPSTKAAGASGFLWVATVGLPEYRLQQRVQAEASRTAERKHKLAIPAAWRLLRDHQAHGHHIVIVTGCWENLAQPSLQRLGLEGFTLVGSRTRTFLGGYVSYRHCYGPRKLECLAEHGIHPPWDYAYSDSASDLPVLSQARQPALVRPSALGLRTVRQRLSTVVVVR